MAECIVAAAIKHPDGEIYALPAPKRHHHIIRWMAEEGRNGKNGCDVCNQGFLTSYGRFVDREEGATIAIAASQISRKTGPDHILFSEDIW